MIGRWAVNGGGRLGKIERQVTAMGSQHWAGTGLDGAPWKSMAPQIIGGVDHDRLENLLETEWKYEELG